MTTLHIDLTEELKSRLAACAAETGFPSIEQYIQSVLQASTEPEMSEEELERLLVNRAADSRPGTEYTPQFSAEFREQVRQRRQARETNP